MIRGPGTAHKVFIFVLLEAGNNQRVYAPMSLVFKGSPTRNKFQYLILKLPLLTEIKHPKGTLRMEIQIGNFAMRLVLQNQGQFYLRKYRNTSL